MCGPTVCGLRGVILTFFLRTRAMASSMANKRMIAPGSPLRWRRCTVDPSATPKNKMAFSS